MASLGYSTVWVEESLGYGTVLGAANLGYGTFWVVVQSRLWQSRLCQTRLWGVWVAAVLVVS